MNKTSNELMLRNNLDLMLDFYGMAFDGEKVHRSKIYKQRYRNLNGYK